MIRKVVLILIAIGAVALLSFRITQALRDKEQAGAPRPGGARPAVVVDTAKVAMASFEETVELTGELRPIAQVEVAPKISGRLSEVLVDNGDIVRKGQLLARFDDQELVQQVGRARAALQVAEAGVRQDQANLQNLRNQRNRFEKLYEEKLVPLQDLEDLRLRTTAAEAQAELGQAQVSQARAALRELEIQLEQTRLYAPMSGHVGERTLHPGALVTPSSSILSVLDLSRVKTVVAAPEQRLSRLRVGLAARITVDAYPNDKFSGTISRISPMLNPATRTAEVEIMVPNRESLLKAGMFVRAAVVLSKNESLAMPREALINRDNRVGVFVINDGRAHFLNVKVGATQSGKVQVLQGLEPGQEIIAAGAQFLSEGDPVRGPAGGESPSQPGARQVGGRSTLS